MARRPALTTSSENQGDGRDSPSGAPQEAVHSIPEQQELQSSQLNLGLVSGPEESDQSAQPTTLGVPDASVVSDQHQLREFESTISPPAIERHSREHLDAALALQFSLIDDNDSNLSDILRGDDLPDLSDFSDPQRDADLPLWNFGHRTVTSQPEAASHRPRSYSPEGEFFSKVPTRSRVYTQKTVDRPWPSSLPRPADLESRWQAFVPPISDTESGSPLLNIASKEALLCVMDFLSFPDIFSLALTCKAIASLINLPRKKELYRRYLKEAMLSRSSSFALASSELGAGARFCDVCLYALDESYFPKEPASESGSSEEMEAPEVKSSGEDENVCRDCAEFRDRTKRGLSAFVPWRPSRRIFVDRLGGYMWYRRRI